MAKAQPAGQARNAFERDHGNFATVALMPNGSGNVLPSATVPYVLEAGDTCYLAVSGTTGLAYLCVSAGTSGGGDAVWVPSTGQGPWPTVLYVSVIRGNNTTAVRGNANLPFATLQAALNAMQSGDEILGGPEVMIITATLTIPATVVTGTISGTNKSFNTAGVTQATGTGGLFIKQTTVGQAVFDLGATLGLSTLVLRHMTLRGASNTDLVITADGSAYAAGTFLNTLVLENVQLANGICTFKYVGGAQFTRCTGLGTTASFTSCGLVNINLTQNITAAIALTIDNDDPLCGGAAGTRFLALREATMCSGLVTLSKQAFLIVDQTSSVGGLKGSGLTVNAGVTRGPGLCVSGLVSNSNAGVIDFASAGDELPDTALSLVLDLRGATLYTINDVLGGTLGIVGVSTMKFKVGGAAGNFQTVTAQNIEALPATTFTADAKIHLQMRDAVVAQAVYTTPGADGDINPPMLTGTIDVSAGGAVAKTWVNLGYAGFIRSGVAPDTAFLTASAQASDPVITTKATTGLTITSSVVGGDTACNWMAVWK